jgi:PPOX class probable F420-dependent enzyme
VEPARAWDLFCSSEVAVLATIGPDGAPDLVPVVFAPVGPRTLVTPIDQKPKTTRRLHRLDNIDADPRVSLLAQHWDSDWERLWWVRAEGRGNVVKSIGSEPARALAERYPPYRERPPAGPWVLVEIERLVGWQA